MGQGGGQVMHGNCRDTRRIFFCWGLGWVGVLSGQLTKDLNFEVWRFKFEVSHFRSLKFEASDISLSQFQVWSLKTQVWSLKFLTFEVWRLNFEDFYFRTLKFQVWSFSSLKIFTFAVSSLKTQVWSLKFLTFQVWGFRYLTFKVIFGSFRLV